MFLVYMYYLGQLITFLGTLSLVRQCNLVYTSFGTLTDCVLATVELYGPFVDPYSGR